MGCSALLVQFHRFCRPQNAPKAQPYSNSPSAQRTFIRVRIYFSIDNSLPLFNSRLHTRACRGVGLPDGHPPPKRPRKTVPFSDRGTFFLSHVAPLGKKYVWWYSGVHSFSKVLVAPKKSTGLASCSAGDSDVCKRSNFTQEID